ncbi:CHAT domain-containing protein [Georgenia muralis]|uniref:CHAT domain-containing protein n=1 Tax=Georgenia muralis TaxID=154117 RepID=A0A3N4Z1L5_9MICO|nr:CHAT domain-containing protein [Georgenia muralis]RPF26423.1 CHAT domain-containing protein [Georgenia muralis]
MPADPALLWERAVTASERGRPVAAVRLLERALTQDPSPDLRVRILISLAHARAESAGVGEGLTELDRAAPGPSSGASALVLGLWYGQRGLLLLRAGRLAEAAVDLDHAAELIGPGSPVDLARVLLNRGVLAMGAADLERAEADFGRCLAVAEGAGLHVHAAKAGANLAYLAHLRGDVPRALRLLDDATPALAAESPVLGAVAALDRARALAAAGLLTESAAALDAAIPVLGRARLVQDQAEAELTAAEVARLHDDVRRARRLAARAQARFARRGASGWAAVAGLEVLRADLAALPGRRAVARAERAADGAAALERRLADLGLTEEGRTARLLRVQALLAAGRTAEATSAAGGWAAVTDRSRLATRMLAHETRANLAAATGRSAVAQRLRAAGLRDLATFQSRLGSLDLATAATAVGADLARAGLAEALRSGRTTAVLAWSERVRATSSRLPPVRGSADPAVVAALARLRILRETERSERLAGAPHDPRRAAAIRDLQQEVTRLTWHHRAPDRAVRATSLEDVRAVLADATLVSLVITDGVVRALTVTGSRARLVPVAAASDVRETVLRVRADLDVLAGRLPARMRGTVLSSLRRGLGSLDALTAGAAGGDGPVVVVPAGLSAQVPWPMLPSLTGRAVSVVPSATWWVDRVTGPGATVGAGTGVGGTAGVRGTAAGDRVQGAEVFVAGPDVPRGAAEVTASAGPGATVLTGSAATTRQVLAAMEGAAVLHVAAHGSHEADNPLFSSLVLTDGALFGHDLESVAALPRHVVLSACETGLASIRTGDEALGMTAAFLHGGARTVVGSVGRVGDEVAEQVAVAHHRGVRSGLPPAAALAAALGEADDVAPLVCFGAGW